MAEEKIIGMYVTNEFVQMCCYDEEQNDVVAVGEGENVETFVLSTELFYEYDTSRWFFGNEALNRSLQHGGDLFTDILNKIQDSKILIYDGMELHYRDLYAILLKLQIESLFGQDVVIKQLVLSMKEADEKMLECIDVLRDLFELDDCQIHVISTTTAALKFIFQQSRDIWLNGCCLYEYTEQGLCLTRFERKRQIRQPVVEVIKERKYQMPNYDLQLAQDNLDQQLLQICKEDLVDYSTSGVILIGAGFETDWCKKTLGFLCRGRRVFLGQNLYAKGACYEAISNELENNNAQGLIVVSDEMIHHDIQIMASYKGKTEMVPIVKGNQEWFNSKGNITVFLDSTNRLELGFYNRVTKEMVREVIKIQGLPMRPPKTTKLKISISFNSANSGEIHIKDMGFGTLFPTTNKVYRKEFHLE